MAMTCFHCFMHKDVLRLSSTRENVRSYTCTSFVTKTILYLVCNLYPYVCFVSCIGYICVCFFRVFSTVAWQRWLTYLEHHMAERCVKWWKEHLIWGRFSTLLWINLVSATSAGPSFHTKPILTEDQKGEQTII